MSLAPVISSGGQGQDIDQVLERGGGEVNAAFRFMILICGAFQELFPPMGPLTSALNLSSTQPLTMLLPSPLLCLRIAACAETSLPKTLTIVEGVSFVGFVTSSRQPPELCEPQGTLLHQERERQSGATNGSQEQLG
jgi:hypothetical protein